MEIPDVIKAVGLFGGGISGTGGPCGALLGGVAVISSLYSRGDLSEKENPSMWRLGRGLVEKFDELTAEFGGRDCRHIARVDWADREQVKAYYGNPEGRMQYCLRLVGDTALALGEMLDAEEKKDR